MLKRSILVDNEKNLPDEEVSYYVSQKLQSCWRESGDDWLNIALYGQTWREEQ